MDISIDSVQVQRLIGYLDGIDYGAEKALYRTLTDVQKKAKVEASKKIRTQLALTKAYVDSKLRVGKPSYSNLTATVNAERRGVLMTRFAYRKTSRGTGYDVKINPSNGYKNLPGAFLLPQLKNSGVPGLAIRKNGKIEVLHAPSVSQVMNTFLPDLQKQMSEYAAVRLEKEVSGVLRQKGF